MARRCSAKFRPANGKADGDSLGAISLEYASPSSPLPPPVPTQASLELTPNLDTLRSHCGEDEPRTHGQLYQRLVAQLERKPTQTVAQLVAYHNRFPEFQSISSFNLLLQHAIHHHYQGFVLLLSRQLNNSSTCAPNPVTLRLWARYLSELGRDQHAWTTLVKSTPSTVIDRIPSDVWKEFLRAPRLQKQLRSNPNPRGPFLSTIGFGSLFVTFIESSLQRNSNAVDNLHFLRMFVARLVKEGFIFEAAHVTERVLRAAPLEIPQRHEALLLEVVHQFLAFGPTLTASHFQMRRLLGNFLAIRPSLRYGATTLHLLLRSLARTKNHGWGGIQLLREWLEKWGPSVETDAVQLRIAQYATRDRRDDIVTVLLSRRQHPNVDLRLKCLSTTQPSPPYGVLRLPMPQIYSKSGQRRSMLGLVSLQCKRAARSRSDESFPKITGRLNRRLERAIATWKKRHGHSSS